MRVISTVLNLVALAVIVYITIFAWAAPG